MKKLSAIRSEKIWGYEDWIASTHPGGQQPELLALAGGDYPLLVKVIQADETLSVQVHPDDEKAALYEQCRGKTECWYVLAAAENAQIVCGLSGDCSAQELESAIRSNSLQSCLKREAVSAGDFVYIPAGTVHAICGGLRLLEIQQSSDVTYRLYDYDRLCDGKPRELHIQQSLDVISAPFKDCAPPMLGLETVNRRLKKLAGCTFFTVWKADICGAETVVQDQNYMIVTVIEGSGFADEQKIAKGSSFIIPSAYGSVRFSGTMQLIISSS